MRTLTIYVVRHADDAPLTVQPTMKAANAYLAELAADNGEPLCLEWHIESRSFADNSRGAASMMSWLLGQCSNELIDGFEAQRKVVDVRDWLSSLIELGTINLARDDDWPRLTSFCAGGSVGPTPPILTDLEVATPEVSEPVH